MEIGEFPAYLIILINSAAWFLFNAAAGLAAFLLPRESFDPRSALYRLRGFEREGTLYRTLFRVERWKSLLPDGAKLFKSGFPKKHLISRKNEVYYTDFLRETCRAELTHWLVIAATPLFFLWNEWRIAVFMVPYALLSNLPCIIAQRYNRPRIEKYMLHFRDSFIFPPTV